VLLPFTTPDDTESRLLQEAAEIQPASGPGFEVRLKSFHTARDFSKGDDANTIMARLLSS
jgi:hypothetical protein